MRADLRRTGLRRPAAPLTTGLTATVATVLTTALAAGLLLGATAAPAAADTPSPIGIGPVSTDAYQRGAFQVSAWTDAPGVTVTQVSATLRKGDTVVAEIPSVPEFTWNRGRFGTNHDPLKLTEDGGAVPALGRYAVDVTATDSRGNRHTRTDAGVLDFTLMPQLEFGLSAPGWDDRNAVPSGTLTGVQPGSGDIVPLSGRGVDIRRTTPPESPVQSPVTTETGAYTGEAYGDVRPGDTFKVAFAEDSDEVHGSVSYDHSLHTYRPHVVTVKASVDRARVLPGQHAVVTGRMTDPQNGGAPLAGQQVKVGPGALQFYDSAYAKVVTTDADGRFTARIPALPGPAGGWSAVPVDPYQRFSGDVGGPLANPQEARIILGSRVLSNEGRVSVTSTLRATYDLKASFDAQAVYLEVSADGRTGWRQVGSTKANDYYPTTTVTATSRGGHYRLRHPQSDVFTEAVSGVFRLVRTEARITGMNAGPEPVRKGAYVTATGTLQHHTSGAWRAYGNGAVALQFQAKGSTAWRQVATGRSTAGGKVSLRAKATVDGTWRLRYYGDATHFHAPVPWADYVDVR
ncbi:hypothetical protein [Streptomyces sp. NPDC002057]|uniref:hypothetical protein n=1 Tax=Streptomyces sp. NPDC002057 TaxID=3154664 RepID=UPI00331AFF12